MFWNKVIKPGFFGERLTEYELELKSGENCAAARIFCIFTENHNDSKTLAAKILRDFLDNISPDRNIRLDEQMRETSSMEWSINWRNYSIDDFFTKNMNESERRAVIIFASFNPNGFIREQAVKIMKNYDCTLPYAVLRRNDWVKQVREAAAEAIEHRLNNLSDGELIAALPFADKLSRSKRALDSETTAERIFAALNESENEAALFAGLRDTSLRTRRICTYALFNSKTPNIELALKRLQYETEPFLRGIIFKCLVSCNQDMSTALDTFLADKFPLNKIMAFQYICEKEPQRAYGIAEKLLLDRNATVRENARYYYKTNNLSFDYRSFYICHMQDCIIPSIYGLGETGVKEDTAILKVYISDEKSSVVCATMTALMRLDETIYAPLITELLTDCRLGVVKTACSLIIKSGIKDYDRLLEIFNSSPYENTKRKCFSILLTASKWCRLEFILIVLECSDGELAKSAKTALDSWIISYNHLFAEATTAQTAELLTKVDKVANKLPTSTVKQLKFLLR